VFVIVLLLSINPFVDSETIFLRKKLRLDLGLVVIRISMIYYVPFILLYHILFTLSILVSTRIQEIVIYKLKKLKKEVLFRKFSKSI